MAKLTVAAESSRITGDAFLTEENVFNAYAVAAPDGARSRIMFRSCLGYGSAFATLGVLVARAMATVNGTLYAVGSGGLYSISAAGVATLLGTVTDDADTTISGNGTNVVVAAGGTYYVWNGSTLSTPGSGRIATVGTVGYVDGYTILSEDAGDEFEWTDLNDPSTRNALNFATAESENDNLLRVHKIGSNLWAVGAESVEFYYNTGQAGADAFSRVSGGVMNRGCLGVLLSTVFDAGDGSGHNLFWVGDDKRPYRANSISPQPLPRSEGVIADIEAETPSHCFHYEDQGRKFFCVRFANRPAWCFDTTQGFWHRRGTDVTHDEWEIIATAKVGATWYGLTGAGTIYAFARVNADDGKALRRTIVFRPVDFGGDQFSVRELEIVAHSGNADIGRDATAMLRIKRDGRPWSSEITRSLGAYGEYGRRAVWRGLGRQRVASYEVSISDAADISIASDANMAIE